ncbi:MAG: MGMT family protein [Actinomycetota bacterium]|nr:MGMT family protein [Actinomycetota bacterium]
MTWTTYGSPFGSLTLTGDENHLRRLYFPGRAPSLNEADRDPEAFTHAVEQLEQYFAGDRQTFELPLELEGTAFQQRAWHALQHLRYGQTTTYGDLARELCASSARAQTPWRRSRGSWRRRSRRPQPRSSCRATASSRPMGR